MMSLNQHIEYINFGVKSSWTSLYKQSLMNTRWWENVFYFLMNQLLIKKCYTELNVKQSVKCVCVCVCVCV